MKKDSFNCEICAYYSKYKDYDAICVKKHKYISKLNIRNCRKFKFKIHGLTPSQFLELQTMKNQVRISIGATIVTATALILSVIFNILNLNC